MVEFKVIIGDPKTGKSYQKAVNDDLLIGRTIGEKINGELVGLKGYELQITGGSDNAGFPMRPDIVTSGRKKALLGSGPGFKVKKKAKSHSQQHYHLKKRKTVRGNTISDQTAQVNLKVVKYGKEALENLFPKKEEKKE